MLGFVGNTGDARGHADHLHFEVHPLSLLFLGYDGAVNPTPYLDAWQHLQDVRFTNVAGWLRRRASSNPAPEARRRSCSRSRDISKRAASIPARSGAHGPP